MPKPIYVDELIWQAKHQIGIERVCFFLIQIFLVQSTKSELNAGLLYFLLICQI